LYKTSINVGFFLVAPTFTNGVMGKQQKLVVGSS